MVKNMEANNQKAIGCYVLVCSLPVLFAVPGITEYPLAVAGAIVVAVIGLNLMDVQGRDVEPERERSRPVACPGV